MFFRWLNTFKEIKVAGHGKQLKVADAWSGDDIVVENAPFKFAGEKKGDFSIKTAPWGYLDDIQSHVIGLLECLQK